jgi:hypothetical protein
MSHKNSCELVNSTISNTFCSIAKWDRDSVMDISLCNYDNSGHYLSSCLLFTTFQSLDSVSRRDSD